MFSVDKISSGAALALGVLVGTLGCYSFHLITGPDESPFHALFAGGGVGLSVWLIVLLLQRTSRIRAFRDLFDDSPRPSFLVNQEGEVLSMNSFATQECGDVKTLVDGLSDDLSNAAEVVYRFGREARDNHHAQGDIVWKNEPAMLDVRNVNNDMQIWLVLPARSIPLAVSEIVGSLPRLLIEEDGRIVSMNDTAKEVLPQTADTVNELLENGPLRRYSVHKIAGNSDKSFRFWDFEADKNRKHVLLIPHDETEPPSAVPDHMLEDLPVSLMRLSPKGALLYVNAAARGLLGRDAIVGARLDDLIEGLGRSVTDRLRETIAGRAQGRAEVARQKHDGVDTYLQVTMTRVTLDNTPSILAVLNDATELKTLEAQFVQSQKMQAVGQLAGGIAHDFNNLLTAIHGHCDLLLLRHETGDSNHSDLIQIRQNANRAAALVRQLLAFSRKQTLRPHVLNLFDTIAELAHLLNRLLGEKVTLEVQNIEEIWPVRVDERQLEQVVVNLVVNARDAMQNGGVVKLRTRNIELTQDLNRDRATVPAGRYGVIEVSDTGIGIPPDNRNKIFDPFFTTKKIGEGTGLGLSTAYGIIKQTGGFIFVDSEPGEGTLFSIYLPVHEKEESEIASTEVEAAAEPSPFKDLTGRGVILVVEDEAPVRSFAVRALQLRGYTVLEAETGEQALELLSSDDTHVDLFVSDVIMPGLNGPSWVRQAIEARPSVSTIFMSGYAEDAFDDGNPNVPNSSFLAKPFSLTELTTRVREHMDEYVN